MEPVLDSGVTGADVRAAAVVARLPDAVGRRLTAAVALDDWFGDLDGLARVAGPAALGLGSGRWLAVFAPLFGEFE